MNKSSMNKVILIGRLGQNPEQKQLQNGMAICNFSIATTDTRKDASGQYVDNTEWHNIVSFGKQAEFIGQIKPHKQRTLETLHKHTHNKRTHHITKMRPDK